MSVHEVQFIATRTTNLIVQIGGSAIGVKLDDWWIVIHASECNRANGDEKAFAARAWRRSTAGKSAVAPNAESRGQLPIRLEPTRAFGLTIRVSGRCLGIGRGVAVAGWAVRGGAIGRLTVGLCGRDAWRRVSNFLPA
jgi:hypothetical protein